MNKPIALQIKEEIIKTQNWDKIMLVAHNAYITMGTFQEPLDSSLIDLTYGQWQLEKARRISLAVISEIIKLIE